MSNSRFLLLVAGSRTFNDYELMDSTLDNLLQNVSEDIVIVSGGAQGADKLAERYAIEHDYQLRVFPADWDRFGKSAGYKRNRQMHEFIATSERRGCVCFWDGESRGTKHNFALAKEFNTPLRIKRFNPIVHNNSTAEINALAQKLVEEPKGSSTTLKGDIDVFVTNGTTTYEFQRKEYAPIGVHTEWEIRYYIRTYDKDGKQKGYRKSSREEAVELYRTLIEMGFAVTETPNISIGRKFQKHLQAHPYR